MWIHRFLTKMGLAKTKQLIIHCNNKSALHMVHNLVFHGRTKHIEENYHFVRDLVLEGTIQLLYIPIALNNKQTYI